MLICFSVNSLSEARLQCFTDELISPDQSSNYKQMIFTAKYYKRSLVFSLSVSVDYSILTRKAVKKTFNPAIVIQKLSGANSNPAICIQKKFHFVTYCEL